MLDSGSVAEDIARLLDESNVPALCAVEDDQLFLIIKEMRRQKQLSDDRLETIDQVWRWKTARLATTSKTSPEDFLHFADGLSRIANDLSESYLNQFRKKFHARWNGLIDLHILLAREKQPKNDLVTVPEVWKLTVRFIAKSANQCVGFDDLFEYFSTTDAYKLKTKGGQTHRIGPMRNLPNLSPQSTYFQ